MESFTPKFLISKIKIRGQLLTYRIYPQGILVGTQKNINLFKSLGSSRYSFMDFMIELIA